MPFRVTIQMNILNGEVPQFRLYFQRIIFGFAALLPFWEWKGSKNKCLIFPSPGGFVVEDEVGGSLVISAISSVRVVEGVVHSVGTRKKRNEMKAG